MHKTALGYAEASDLHVTAFDGQTVDSSCLIVAYTFAGDCNLDKTVNTLDFTMLAAGFGQANQSWLTGDFNYDGVVNALDFNALATNFGSTLSSPALGSVVPEPQFLCAIASLFLAARRRRGS